MNHCDYCDKELSRRSFCSEAHKKKYYRKGVPARDIVDVDVPLGDAVVPMRDGGEKRKRYSTKGGQCAWHGKKECSLCG